MSYKCYARGCDYNNPDHTCMYGDKKPCRVNCSNCVYDCKAKDNEACRGFKIKESKKNE